jgi:hypothetical protein
MGLEYKAVVIDLGLFFIGHQVTKINKNKVILKLVLLRCPPSKCRARTS